MKNKREDTAQELEVLNLTCQTCHWCDDPAYEASSPVCGRLPVIVERQDDWRCAYHITTAQFLTSQDYNSMYKALLVRDIEERAMERGEMAKNREDMAKHRILYEAHMEVMKDHMEAIENLGERLLRTLPVID